MGPWSRAREAWRSPHVSGVASPSSPLEYLIRRWHTGPCWTLRFLYNAQSVFFGGGGAAKGQKQKGRGGVEEAKPWVSFLFFLSS